MLTGANSYEPIGSRTGVLQNTKDGYEMIKVSFFQPQKVAAAAAAVAPTS